MGLDYEVTAGVMVELWDPDEPHPLVKARSDGHHFHVVEQFSCSRRQRGCLPVHSRWGGRPCRRRRTAGRLPPGLRLRPSLLSGWPSAHQPCLDSTLWDTAQKGLLVYVATVGVESAAPTGLLRACPPEYMTVSQEKQLPLPNNRYPHADPNRCAEGAPPSRCSGDSRDRLGAWSMRE